MEYLDLKGSKAGAALGAQIADLHLHNQKLLNSPSTSRITTLSNDDPAEESDSRGSSSLIHEKRFGFHVPTSCGYIAQNNSWCDDWPSLITRKLDEQIHKLQSESRPGREALLLWPALQRVIPSLFDDLKEPIIPSLLHGDLWTGNVGSVTEDGVSKPVVFDPACFYGHHEYDLAIAGMFGGFGSAFWSSYFDRIPKQAGWDRRHKLYQLFHYLNHWNHFGSGYASSSLGIMRELTK
uniref:protein-ribulosamine 3-kinase n=2 Tax=Hirondellea gigas TaxID=1518452 RepID=A0A2P2I3D2_9CRUS